MLTEKERKILELRKKGLKQVDIAKKLGISQPAVSAFEANALKKIKEAAGTMEFARNNDIKIE